MPKKLLESLLLLLDEVLSAESRLTCPSIAVRLAVLAEMSAPARLMLFWASNCTVLASRLLVRAVLVVLV